MSTLIKMHRDTPEFKGGPTVHLSHPDNVEKAKIAGWKVTPIAEGRGQVPGPDRVPGKPGRGKK